MLVIAVGSVQTIGDFHPLITAITMLHVAASQSGGHAPHHVSNQATPISRAPASHPYHIKQAFESRTATHPYLSQHKPHTIHRCNTPKASALHVWIK